MAGYGSTGMRRGLTVAVAAVVVGLGAAAGATAAQEPAERSAWGSVTSRESVNSAEAQANNNGEGSGNTAISANGRFVAFESYASNLVASDTNDSFDVFVRDRVAGTTRRVSVGPGGVQANGHSESPAISADGRYLAFMSTASNLVPADTNRRSDVFVRDRVAGVTQRVSIGPDGQQANGGSRYPAISADGRHVAFTSAASNLVPGDSNEVSDVFVRDRATDATRRVSVGPGRRQANGASRSPAISADGRHVAFSSPASNLVAGDTNHFADVFVRDRQTKATWRVSVGPAGRQANRRSGSPAISADGRHVAFNSPASNLVAEDTNHLVDVFVRDRQANVTRRASIGPNGRQANGVIGRFGPAISANGRHVTFWSASDNLVAGDTNNTADVFVRDRVAKATRRASVGPDGRQANAESFDMAISADGRHVAFASVASNLVPGDTNSSEDVFVRDRFGDAG